MKRVTLDTNVFPVDDLAEARGKFELVHVTVTGREVERAPPHVHLEGTGRASETLWLGESRLNESVLASESSPPVREILDIISNGSFPAEPIEPSNLQPGQRRQLRDALIFEAHVRLGRDMFVTDDGDFLDDGRREALERRFGTRILTRAEFERLLK